MQHQIAATEKRRAPIVQPEENLAELLLEVRQAQSQETVGSDEPEIEVAPEAPIRYNDLFKNYLAYEAELGRVASRQQMFEASLFNTSLTEDPRTAGIRSIADQAVKLMIRRAETMFAPSGSTLEICESEALEATGQERWNRWDHRDRCDAADPDVPVDLDKLWDHLEATYGGDAGKTLGLKQLADFIVRELGLRNNEAVKRTSSAAVIQRRTWSEKKDYGPNKGMFEVSYSGRDHLAKLFTALSAVFEHAEQYDLAAALQPRKHQLADYNFCFKSRDRFTFPGLEIVCFKEYWEWRFSHTSAETLMVFLGTYATPESDR